MDCIVLYICVRISIQARVGIWRLLLSLLYRILKQGRSKRNRHCAFYSSSYFQLSFPFLRNALLHHDSHAMLERKEEEDGEKNIVGFQTGRRDDGEI